ncbi:MAG: nicotinate (nicotinamide) nucleotide adenylyltransferase [Thermoanaerobaculia bacterium]|nr:nicotinate (nicotinamide) nucleotide adenylyltransferase [Thermoanaerobaculia bacterium]
MKIGICGGTFDPFHRGHLDPILAVRDAMQWRSVFFIPAFRQPFKTERATASGYHRFAMAVLATERHNDLHVSNWELERGAVSYTVETLAMLRETHSEATLDWIIGDDNLAQLGEWKDIDRIFELANFVVLSRFGELAVVPDTYRRRVVAADERKAHGAIVIAHNTEVPVSSTEIRRRIRSGESIAELVDPRVSRYIQHNRLYREAQQ